MPVQRAPQELLSRYERKSQGELSDRDNGCCWGSIPIWSILQSIDLAGRCRFLGNRSTRFLHTGLVFFFQALAKNAYLTRVFKCIADGWSQGVIATDKTVKLVIEDVTNGWLQC